MLDVIFKAFGIHEVRYMKAENTAKMDVADMDLSRGYNSPVTSTFCVNGTNTPTKEVHFHTNQYGNALQIYKTLQIGPGGFAFKTAISSVASKVVEVFIWPDCNPLELGNSLARWKYGRNANWSLVAALGDLELAKNWMREFTRIEPGKVPDEMLVDGRTVSLYSPFYTPLTAHEHLIQVHGAANLFSEHLGEAQASFVKALTSMDEATKFLLSHYRVVLAQSGTASLVKFASKEDPENLTQAVQDGQSWKIEGLFAVRVLMDKYPQILEKLTEESSEQVTLVPTFPRHDPHQGKDGWWYYTIHGADGREVPLFHQKNARFVEFSQLRGAMTNVMANSNNRGRIGWVTNDTRMLKSVLNMEGGEGYIVSHSGLLALINEGQERNFFILHGKDVYGVTLKLAGGELQVNPYNGPAEFKVGQGSDDDVILVAS